MPQMKHRAHGTRVQRFTALPCKFCFCEVIPVGLFTTPPPPCTIACGAHGADGASSGRAEVRNSTAGGKGQHVKLFCAYRQPNGSCRPASCPKMAGWKRSSSNVHTCQGAWSRRSRGCCNLHVRGTARLCDWCGICRCSCRHPTRQHHPYLWGLRLRMVHHWGWPCKRPRCRTSHWQPGDVRHAWLWHGYLRWQWEDRGPWHGQRPCSTLCEKG